MPWPVCHVRRSQLPDSTEQCDDDTHANCSHLSLILIVVSCPSAQHDRHLRLPDPDEGGDGESDEDDGIDLAPESAREM